MIKYQSSRMLGYERMKVWVGYNMIPGLSVEFKLSRFAYRDFIRVGICFNNYLSIINIPINSCVVYIVYDS